MRLQIIDVKSYSFRVEDLWMLAEMETHPEVVKWNLAAVTDDKNKMYNLFEKAIEKLPHEEDQIFLVEKLNDKIIGFLGIRRYNRREVPVGDLGITIHPDYWNRGFGTRLLKAGVERARKEGLRELKAETLASDETMIRIAEKVGFIVEDVDKRGRKHEDRFQLCMILQ